VPRRLPLPPKIKKLDPFIEQSVPIPELEKPKKLWLCKPWDACTYLLHTTTTSPSPASCLAFLLWALVGAVVAARPGPIPSPDGTLCAPARRGSLVLLQRSNDKESLRHTQTEGEPHIKPELIGCVTGTPSDHLRTHCCFASGRMDPREPTKSKL